MRTRFLFTSLLVLGACSTLPPAQRPMLPHAAIVAADADSNLYPLGEGMAWQYRLTQLKDGQPSGRQDVMSSRVTAVSQTPEGRKAKVERAYSAMTVPATEALVTDRAVRLARWPQETPAAVPSAAPSTVRSFVGAGSLLFPAVVRPTLRLSSGFAAADVPKGNGELTTTIEVLHFPLTAGESWTGRVWTFAKETLTAQGWEPLTVPAGTFKTWHVSHRIAYDDGRVDNLGYWYAPGIGMVKAHEETSMATGGTLTKFGVDGELSSFTGSRP